MQMDPATLDGTNRKLHTEDKHTASDAKRLEKRITGKRHKIMMANKNNNRLIIETLNLAWRPHLKLFSNYQVSRHS